MKSKHICSSRLIKHSIDIVFLALMSIYLLYSMSLTSTFFFPFPVGFVKGLFILLSCSAILRCLFVFSMYWKKTHDLKWFVTVFAVLWLTGVYFFVYISDGFSFLLFMGVLTVGCVGLDYRKLLRLHTILFSLFLLITFISALGGAIDNYVYMKDGYIRSAWGICYPTDFASSVFFAVLLIWVAWEQLPDTVVLPIALVGVYISKIIAMSITSTICFASLAFVIMLRIVYCKAIRIQEWGNKVRKIGGWVLIIAFPLLAGIMFLLISAYGRGFSVALIIDNLLSRRLYYAWEVLQECGITLFGTPFAQIGNGFSVFSSQKYHFVDSTYPLLLIRYGLILFVTYCITWPYTVKRALKAQDWRLAWAMMLIAIHSFSEHHFIEVNYDLLVVMPFAAFPTYTELLSEHKDSNNRADSVDLRKRWKWITILLSLFLLVMFTTPRVLSWMRTVIEALDWTGGGWNGVRVAGSVTFVLAIFGLLVFCFWRGITKYYMAPLSAGKYVLGGSICVTTLLGVFSAANQRTMEASDMFEPTIREEADVLQQVLRLAEGTVYVNEVPELYHRYFPQLGRSIFYKDELARCYNITAIMDRAYDSDCFINSGFLFTPISEKHAIYTNDLGVIRGLEDLGVHLTGYYNIEKEVSLRQMAQINSLSYEDKEGLILSGSGKTMKNGPYLSLYSGLYSVWYDFALDDGKSVSDMKEDELLGTLSVSARYGEEVLKEQKVFRSQFDKDGKYSAEVKFWTNNYRGIEFQAQLESGQIMKLEGLRYARTPAYDVHAFYDRNRKKYREEYYSLAGERITTPEGYASCEYDYNYDRVINEIRYYDENNNPVLINAGYAQVKRKLDEKNRIIREEYYGTDGKPVLLAQGYASNEREYDEENNAIVQRYYDTNGKPVITTWNYSEVHREFDEKKRVIKESYYGPDGFPMDMPQGYATIEKTYDEAGNVLSQRYYDALKKPVMTTWNYAEIRWEYNEKNQIVRESYYDAEEHLITIPQGYAINEREYDSAGNAIVQRYCNALGLPVMTIWNYSEIHREFDENRRILRESYFNTTGEPVKVAAGYAEIRREYNDKNQVSKESYYDVKGQIQIMPEGYAYNEREYDEEGNVNVQRYLDTDGIPVMTTWNYAEVHRVFNENKQVIRESYFGVDGKPINMPQGYAVNERSYDENGNANIQRYCDANGIPVITTWNFAEVHRVFDKKHRVIEQRYYGTDGNPIALPGGQYSDTRVYDANGQLAVMKYFGINGKPIMLTLGYSELHRDYNEKAQISKESYFDTDGQPAVMSQGYSVEEREYDEAGNVKIQRYLNADGQLVMTTWGYAEVHRKYDEKRQVIEEKYYDTLGNEVKL